MTYFRCLSRIAAAAGRELTDDEIRKIYEQINKAAKDIRKGRTVDPDVGQLDIDFTAEADAATTGDIDLMVTAAAERAAAEMEHKAFMDLRKKQLFIATLEANHVKLEKLERAGLGEIAAVKGLIARDYSSRVDIESVEQRATGVRDYGLAKLIPTWEAMGKDFFGLFQNRRKQTILMRELKGEDTGNAAAKAGAKAWLDMAEEFRVWANSVGGDIKKLGSWAFPQHHSQEQVAKAGVQAWTDYLFPKLDRDLYINELGDPMNDAEVMDLLRYAWETISTNGHTRGKPGAKGLGSVANRHKAHRQIHIKTAQDQMDYWRKFGGKQGLLEIMYTHVDSMARDIAFMEKMSPNPSQMHATLRDEALARATKRDPSETVKHEAEAVSADELFNYASGIVKPTYRQWLRAGGDAAANLAVAGKLGGAMWASFYGDKPMLEAVSHLNKMPELRRWQNEMKVLNPMNKADRRLLQQQGLMIDTMRSGIQRFYDGLGTGGFTGKIANAVMRSTLFNAINDVRKGAFGINAFHAIGNQIADGVQFSGLHDTDIRLLKNWGITETDWNTWQLAKLRNNQFGDNILMPEAIGQITDAQLVDAGIITAAGGRKAADAARREAVVKLIGLTNTEGEFAVVTPGWRERASFYGSTQRGTVQGEITRAALLFKSFPHAYLLRTADLYANAKTPQGKAGVVAWAILSSTLAGAMIMQTREMLSGRDPLSMVDKPLAFWGKAFLQGGALGLYGDFLYSTNQTRHGSGPIEALSGPILGPLLNLAITNPLTAAKKELEGKDSHFIARQVGQAKGFLPFNNAWPIKAAMEHMVWHNVMEYSSPGYLRSMKRRMRKEYGQKSWWELGELTPSRPPDLKAAIK